MPQKMRRPLKSIFQFHFLALALTPLIVSAAPPISDGLPEVLPLDYVLAEKMVDFEQTPETMHAPIAAGIMFNDQSVPPTDLATLGSVFEERFFAKLPKGEQIQIKNQSPNLPVWDYPTGTTVIHQIIFKNSVRQIFEVRLERKLANGTWAFGTYTQGPKGLELNHYPALKAEKYLLTLLTGQQVKVELSHLNLQSCRACHFMNSPSKYQYPELKAAGPCGFGPAHAKLTTDWANRYFQVHRENPFH